MQPCNTLPGLYGACLCLLNDEKREEYDYENRINDNFTLTKNIDHCDLLEVENNASQDEINEAYMKHLNDTKNKFYSSRVKKIYFEVYACLSDVEQRQLYSQMWYDDDEEDDDEEEQ